MILKINCKKWDFKEIIENIIKNKKILRYYQNDSTMKWLGVIKMIAEVFLKKIKKCKYYYILFQVLYPIIYIEFIIN